MFSFVVIINSSGKNKIGKAALKSYFARIFYIWKKLPANTSDLNRKTQIKQIIISLKFYAGKNKKRRKKQCCQRIVFFPEKISTPL